MIDDNPLRPLTIGEISCNTRIKHYPDHDLYSVASRPVYRRAIVEERKQSGHVPELARVAASDIERSRAESLRRARANIRDICACSAFTDFITLTLSPKFIDRYDYNAIMKKVNRWLGNAVARKGLAYILIPEFHKDGAIHFHGLIRSASPLGLVDSNHRTRAGQIIYNISSWKYGWSVSIPLSGEYSRIVNYIQKYITKDSRKVGGRWYLSGGDIRRPGISYSDLLYDEIDADPYIVPDAGIAFKYIRIDKDGDDQKK